MSNHEAMIPPSVDAEDAELLRRAYALSSQAESKALYREWAATYDRTMIDGLGYISPQRLALQFAQRVEWRDGSVLDIGCGTGLVGAQLSAHGFTTMDGLDLSLEMMATAGERGIYRQFITADLNKPLAIADGSYDAVICNGTFTSGHVDAGCLDEIVRVIEVGGFFACAVHHAVWNQCGFADGFARLTAAGRLAEIEVFEATYYESSPTPDGRFCLFQRRS
jgi:predicted TPR repeat methyltransferase